MFFSLLEQLGSDWAAWYALVGLIAMIGLLSLPVVLRRNNSLAQRLMLNGKTLGGRLRVGFGVISVVPLLTIIPVLLLVGSGAAKHMQLEQLEKRAGIAATTLPRVFDQQIQIFSGLAVELSQSQQLGDVSPVTVLSKFHNANTEFVSLWFATPAGAVSAATKVSGGKAVSWSGPVAGLAMLDTFAEAVAAKGLYVSPVTRSAGNAARPMVFVSTPVLSANKRISGYVQGLLNLNQLFGLNGNSSDLSVVVLDDKNRVVLASPADLFEPFSNLSGHAMVSRRDDTGRSSFSKGLVQYMSAGQSLSNDWQVYAVASRSGSYAVMLVYIFLAAIWACLALFVGFRLSPFYTESVVAPLKKLDESLDVFDAERTMVNIPNAPMHAPQEVGQIFNRVRKSMRNSRDSYHSMLKAVSEGMELREQLKKQQSQPQMDSPAKGAASSVAETDVPANAGKPVPDQSEPEVTWTGRIDPVTALSGKDAYESFFTEAWTFGATDNRPITLLMIEVLSTDDDSLKSMADCMASAGGRSLDFLARINTWEFAMVLPDTDLNGGLGVAQKMVSAIQGKLPEQAAGVSIGVASIVPNDKGNAKAFIDMARRSRQMAREETGIQIGYISSEGKLSLLCDESSGLQAKIAPESSEPEELDGENLNLEDISLETSAAADEVAAVQPSDFISIEEDIVPDTDVAAEPADAVAQNDNGDEADEATLVADDLLCAHDEPAAEEPAAAFQAEAVAEDAVINEADEATLVADELVWAQQEKAQEDKAALVPEEAVAEDTVINEADEATLVADELVWAQQEKAQKDKVAASQQEAHAEQEPAKKDKDAARDADVLDWTLTGLDV